jgi:hypothetical protein
MAHWTTAIGCLIAVVIIWTIHNFCALHPRTPRRTRDKIWLLEKAFIGVAISIIVLSETRELALVVYGGQLSEKVERDFLFLCAGFILSVCILLVAKIADDTLGDE